MSGNRMDAAKPEGEKGAAPEAAPAAAAAASPTASGGIASWIPLVAAVVLMPVIAWAVTTWILLPKMQKGLGLAGAEPAAAASHGEPAAHGEGAKEKEKAEPAEGGGHGKAEGKEGGGGGSGKEQVALTKLLVNVSGTMGSRYLLTSITLVGAVPDFRAKVEKRDAQLRDTACGILSTKTIPDLEKPGARNIVRSELLTGFNNVLGNGAVAEIYITEFAIQ